MKACHHFIVTARRHQSRTYTELEVKSGAGASKRPTFPLTSRTAGAQFLRALKFRGILASSQKWLFRLCLRIVTTTTTSPATEITHGAGFDFFASYTLLPKKNHILPKIKRIRSNGSRSDRTYMNTTALLLAQSLAHLQWRHCKPEKAWLFFLREIMA